MCTKRRLSVSWRRSRCLLRPKHKKIMRMCSTRWMMVAKAANSLRRRNISSSWKASRICTASGKRKSKWFIALASCEHSARLRRGTDNASSTSRNVHCCGAASRLIRVLPKSIALLIALRWTVSTAARNTLSNGWDCRTRAARMRLRPMLAGTTRLPSTSDGTCCRATRNSDMGTTWALGKACMAGTSCRRRRRRRTTMPPQASDISRRKTKKMRPRKQSVALKVLCLTRRQCIKADINCATIK
mmetsp:Transcript_2179/g.4225  ORF Transcript_2179/g.4225 Transcript_2179/m.4225 type:complete len:244 (-) Transcript_2179:3588-4319(-)